MIIQPLPLTLSQISIWTGQFLKVELDTWRDSWQGRGCKFKFDARSNEGQGGFDVDEEHALESTRKVALICLYILAALVAVA